MTATETSRGTTQTNEAQVDAGAGRNKIKKPSLWFALMAWVIGIFFVSPALWMVWLSFHSEADAAANPPKFTSGLTVDGYRDFFGSGSQSPWPSLVNSLTASVLSTVLVLLLAFPAAYALSIRPVRKWTDVMFFFLSTKMLPAIAGLLPI
jgi:sorbitol/mannitol transport system permease protein